MTAAAAGLGLLCWSALALAAGVAIGLSIRMAERRERDCPACASAERIANARQALDAYLLVQEAEDYLREEAEWT